MNIEKLIHDLRARINPQYYDQLGTESHERYQVVMALEYLRQENERLANDMSRCYRMLLSEPDVKGALFKAENILRESLADRGAK